MSNSIALIELLFAAEGQITDRSVPIPHSAEHVIPRPARDHKMKKQRDE